MSVDGETYYFCSDGCRALFVESPQYYMASRHALGADETREPAPPEIREQHEPPRTTSWGWFTAPMYGSAGSGGAEFEPIPERHKDEA
jgi:hypothetical protein